MEHRAANVSLLPAKGLVATPEAADYLGVSVQFLEQDRLTKRHGIPYVRLGRAIRYRLYDLEAYIEANVVRVAEAA